MPRKAIPLLLLIFLLTLACNRSVPGSSGQTPIVVPVATDVVKATVDAMRPPTTTPSPTPDLSKGTLTPIPPTATYPPTSTPVQDPSCYLDMEATDVTIEDGSEIKINEEFTKTWKLTNIGTCYWTADYQLVFISGEMMGAKSPLPLGKTIFTNDEIEISVNLIAPPVPGSYIGYWQLQMPDGYPVGWVWVEILAVE